MMGVPYFLLGAVIAITVHPVSAKTDSWTAYYSKNFRPLGEQSKNHHTVQISSVVEKWSVPRFSQLIFSWNAVRPTRGFFRFFARVRDKSNKKWLSWHKMAEWGANIQRSFSSAEGQGSSYHFVRLELDDDVLADSFEVKAEALDGASLSDLKMISVTVSNLKCMVPESVGSLRGLSSVYSGSIPRISQLMVDHPEITRICSPVSCSMLISFLMGKSIDPADFADKSYDNGLEVYGNWAFNLAHAFEKSNGKFSFAVKRLHSFKDLHALLSQKIPVVVSVRGELKDAPKPYPNGHLLVVIGYNARTKKVICNDPAQPDHSQVLSQYELGPFLKAWENSHRLAYVAHSTPSKSKRGGP